MTGSSAHGQSQDSCDWDCHVSTLPTIPMQSPALTQPSQPGRIFTAVGPSPCILHVCAGPDREGSYEHHANARGASVVNVDLCRSLEHDVTRDDCFTELPGLIEQSEIDAMQARLRSLRRSCLDGTSRALPHPCGTPNPAHVAKPCPRRVAVFRNGAVRYSV